MNHEQLREEWKDYIGNQRLSNNKIADWWLAKFTELLEGAKKEIGDEYHMIYSEGDCDASHNAKLQANT